ncbi:hypothetical protein TNCV_1553731 [Trichonephila clavipes]|nr:hypothetical protein TNCV_1553731 [Trichonephila clavipes]
MAEEEMGDSGKREEGTLLFQDILSFLSYRTGEKSSAEKMSRSFLRNRLFFKRFRLGFHGNYKPLSFRTEALSFSLPSPVFFFSEALISL